MHKYSEDEKRFLETIAAGRSYREITELFNERFDCSLSETTIKGALSRYGLKNGRDCKFVKGRSPFNKGTRGLMKANSTSFQKGNVPNNYRPVGSERVNADGYVEIKTAEPNKWRCKHKVVWEAENGQVPEGHTIIFADRNRQNITLDNLILVSRAELLVMNRAGLISYDAAATKTGVVIADICLKIGDLKQKGKSNRGKL